MLKLVIEIGTKMKILFLKIETQTEKKYFSWYVIVIIRTKKFRQK